MSSNLTCEDCSPHTLLGFNVDPSGQGMASAAGIHLDGTGKPTEIQISQCWVFNHARGIYMTVRAETVLANRPDPGS